MSDRCGNCDCSDSSQCSKKGNSFGAVMETENSHFDAMDMGFPAAEHGGKCNCGPNCSCSTCSCGH